MERVIEISGLTKKYGDHVVVNNLDLSVFKGEIFGLLGPNGAGKSTTILMMLGLTEPDSGSVRVCDLDPVRNPIKVKETVGYLPEDVGFYDDFTGMENLVFTARLNSMGKSDASRRAAELLDRVGLSEAWNKRAGKYSRGMRQRLGLADVLIKNPEVIILDEPTLGIDPAGVREFLDLIVKLSREEGITVIFSSHLLHQVQQVCDRVGIFVNGRLLAEGDISSLASKLFPDGSFTIEGGIVPRHGKHPKTGPVNLQELQRRLEGINGAVRVAFKNDQFRIESDKDIAPEISIVVSDSGYGLGFLNKKEFGLDDIYYQYFQGGGNGHA